MKLETALELLKKDFESKIDRNPKNPKLDFLASMYKIDRLNVPEASSAFKYGISPDYGTVDHWIKDTPPNKVVEHLERIIKRVRNFE